MKNNNWTKEETIIAFNVYCNILFSKSNARHPYIIEIANIMGRSPDALNMKIGNLGRLDPSLKEKGITGLTHGSKMEEIVWDEFSNNTWSTINILYPLKLIKRFYTKKCRVNSL